MTRPAPDRSLPPDRIVRWEVVPLASIRFDHPHDPDPSYPWDALDASIRRGWNPACQDPPLRPDGNSPADGYTPFVLFPRADGTFAPIQGWHRVEAARRLGIRRVAAFVVRPWTPRDLDGVRDCIAAYRALPSQPQTVDLPWPGCACEGRGDRTRAIWQDSGWNWWEWCGRRVLDIGCSLGMHSIEAARHGADVVGIDRDAEAVKIGDALMDAANIWTGGLVPVDYWTGDIRKPGFPIDIVMAHQNLYWLSQPPHTPDETLDALCGQAGRWITAYTHIMPEPYRGPEPGWRPTEEEAVAAFASRGWRATVRPHDPALGWPTKRTIVARRESPR